MFTTTSVPVMARSQPLRGTLLYVVLESRSRPLLFEPAHAGTDHPVDASGGFVASAFFSHTVPDSKHLALLALTLAQAHNDGQWKMASFYVECSFPVIPLDMRRMRVELPQARPSLSQDFLGLYNDGT